MVSKKIETLISKTDLPVLQIEHEGKMILIHSKYDPVKEAEQILSKYENQIDQFQHVLFYGVGLGYHVKALMEQYPEKIVSTYEPITEVAEACAASRSETKLSSSNLAYTFVETEPEDLERYLHTFSNQLTQKVLLIILPVYERFLKEDIIRFIGRFKEIVDEKKLSIVTNAVFSKRWTINSLMNLPSTFENPSFLLEYRETFKDKPVILAAAGPSLSEEMENLREIKEKGLAYVFAVGSANKALIANGIYPDAVFTYDPQAHNYAVFQPIIDEKINTIPLVYGTSVGFETVQRYPGPKFHFVTSQDTITQLFHETALPVVNDAYSIAIVTLQLLYQLQVKTIILVGQNFAFKNDLFYSEEIKRYDKDTKELSDASVQKDDLEYSFSIADVNGNDILTNKSFDNMRVLMEQYIKQNPQIPVYNTTRGGAAIGGTTYVPLRQLMAVELTEPAVTEKWYEKGTVLPISAQTINKLNVLQNDTVLFIKQYDAMMDYFHDIERSINRLKDNQFQKRLEKIDELMRKLTENTLYDIVIKPITRNFYEKLETEAEVIRKLEPTKEKLIAVANLFMSYLRLCQAVYKETAPIIQYLVLPALLESTGRKEYIATSGVFQYEGKWEKQYPAVEEIPLDLTEEEKKMFREKKKLEDKIEVHVNPIKTTQKHAKIQFRFCGSKLALYGTNHSNGLLKLRITIDNKTNNITIKDHIDEEVYGSFMLQKLFDTTNLKPGMHNVTIEIVSDNPHLLFQGIEIDKNERAYHIHEVTAVDELEIGKRIRCNYKATYNTVGGFSALGEESGEFLTVEASPEPDGDFYFIMVDEVDGEKKLIADRNVKYNITFESLLSEIHKTQIIGMKKSRMRLINVDNEVQANDEWVKYIKNNSINKQCEELVWNHERIAHDNIGSYSFITYDFNQCGVYSVYTDGQTNRYKQHFNTEVLSDRPNHNFGFRPLIELNLI